MAFAPIDLWARMLLAPPAWIPPLYWPRLFAELFVSLIGTVMTLPERLALAPVLAIARARAQRRRQATGTDGETPVVFVLGYFRSGTTHLQYLLACDPNLYTPRWHQALGAAGYVVTWTILRWFFIPFMGNTRPHDEVAFGPDWPAEDDFALNNWGLASSLPGRFVVPGLHPFYSRFHDLKGLTPRERRRWDRLQWGFIWKLRRLAHGRMILLKSPNHTARVQPLIDLLGPDNVRFIHLSRSPSAVVRSNINLYERLSRYSLQPMPAPEEIERRIVDEYARTESAYVDDAKDLPPDRCVEVRYEDLVADPLGQLRRAYDALRLPWTSAMERRVVAYLLRVRGHRVVTAAPPADQPSHPQLSWLRARFGHDRPAIAPVAIPDADLPEPAPRSRRAVLAALLTAAVGIAIWLLIAWQARNRYDSVIWPLGVAIGLVTLRTARVGSARLGAFAATLAIAVFVLTALPATYLSEYVDNPDWHWRRDLLESLRKGAISGPNALWLLLGAGSAYRFASRRHPRPVGMD